MVGALSVFLIRGRTAVSGEKVWLVFCFDIDSSSNKQAKLSGNVFLPYVPTKTKEILHG